MTRLWLHSSPTKLLNPHRDNRGRFAIWPRPIAPDVEALCLCGYDPKTGLRTSIVCPRHDGTFIIPWRTVQVKIWMPKEIAYLRQNWLNLTDTEIGKVLGRPQQSVKKKRQRLGLIHWKEEV